MLKILKKRWRRGQSTVEYAVLIVVVIAALLSIQVYIKRGISGRMKDSADQIGSQFELGNSKGESWTNSYGETKETYNKGVSNTVLTVAETTNTYSNMVISNLEKQSW